MQDELLNKIISVAYNEASILEKIKIYSLAKKDDEVKRVLEQYKRVANQTNNLEIENCPDEILEKVKEKTNYKPAEQSSLSDDLCSFVFSKPKFVMGFAVMFLLTLASTFIFNRKDIHQRYTQKEIQIADKEVRESLRIVANILKQTSNTVEKDVLTDRVSTPIQESINIVNNYLQGDNKNEKIN